MTLPPAPFVPLEKVLKPEQMARRPSRADDLRTENQALATLAQELAARPEHLLQRLVEVVLRCCRAESAGVSLLESDDPAKPHVFRWVAIAGAFADNQGGSLPRNASPCGLVVDRDEVLLFDKPALYFPDLAKAAPEITEALLTPFHLHGRPIGTVWAVMHHTDRHFDAEDARLLKSLSRFAAAGYAMEQRVRQRTRELNREVEERRRADQALRKAYDKLRDQARRLQCLASELTKAEHRERKRLAALLHDHLQQLLVASRINQLRYRRKRDDRLLSQAIDLTDQALTASRTLTHGLRPPVLYEAGLAPALQWLGSQMQQRHGLHVQVETEALDAADARLDDDGKMLLFDCARELLFNTAKHAGVDEATVKLRHDDHSLRIVVADGGKGFDSEAVLERSHGATFGLFGIRERLAALNGRMEITSADGQGTQIELEVPLMSPRPRPDSAEAPCDETLTPAGGPSADDENTISVLVVDDHRILREGVVNVLANDPRLAIAGEAADGHDAIRAIERHRPDVVLMDVNMPGMNGVETTRVVDRRWPGLPVIGLSVQEDEATINAMRQAGAAAFVPKSGDFAHVIQTIVELAARAKSRT